MKFFKNLLLYISLFIVFGSLIYFLLQKGNLHNHPSITQLITDPANPPHPSTPQRITHPINPSHPTNPSSDLLLQIVLIIASTQLLGALFKKIGQPAVIGEIVAGILLGPSLLGLLFPHTFHFLFPPASMDNLRFLSQIGLLLFMFMIGLELDMSLIRRQAFEAVIISHASILIPYALGVGLALFLYDQYAPAGVGFLPFALFMGIAMSITAFPVLARIIRDKKLSGTKLGVLAITCAASDDVTAWCLLALLIAVIKSGSTTDGFYTIGLVLLYAACMLVPVRLFLKKMHRVYQQHKMGYHTLMAMMFVVLLLSAYCTEIIGIHALFGAFLAGVVMPRDAELRSRIINRLNDITMVMLLPLFFVFTGLRTQAGLLNHTSLWISFGLIVLAAVLGKFGGSTLAARLVGQSWKDSLSIGALMNTRGLVELVVLNIGYDMGILTTEIFTMLVLMALLTTIMTSAALSIIQRTGSS